MIASFSGTNRFLSNFYPSKIKDGDITYESVEHYFQANKTFDMEKRKEVAKCSTPGKAKRKGRNLILRKDWESVKDSVMLCGVILKFTNSPELKDKLIATGSHRLVEGNTWGDTYWGVCNGVGENMLGKILMLIRYTIKENEFEVV